MIRRYLKFVVLCFCILTGCQSVIDVDIKPNDDQVVIEGTINNITGIQTITLSRTVNYYQANVYPPLSGAMVVVSNPSGSFVFRETAPGQYTNASIRGRLGQESTLKVTLADKTYTASSTMANQVTLDSLGINLVYVGIKEFKTVSVYYSDPADQLNQYRFIMYVNGVQVKQIFASDDANTNGRIVNNLLYQTDITLKTGDKIDVEMQGIDPQVFNYWYSLSRQGGNSPNSPATPSNPFTNIKGGALGYFSVHTVQRKSIIIL